MENDELLADGKTLTITWSASGATLSTGNATFKDIVEKAIETSKTKSKENSSKYAQAVIKKNSGTYKITVSFS